MSPIDNGASRRSLREARVVVAPPPIRNPYRALDDAIDWQHNVITQGQVDEARRLGYTGPNNMLELGTWLEEMKGD